MMWMEYPKCEALFPVDDQFLVGTDILVKPITTAGALESSVAFPTDDNWYSADTLALVASSGAPGSSQSITVAAPIDVIPVFQRGGSIITRKLRLRRSTQAMKRDPYTLYVALSSGEAATGRLYMDDEESFGYQKRFEYANATLTADFATASAHLKNEVTVGSGWADHVESLAGGRLVERVIVMGLSRAPTSVKRNEDDLVFHYSPTTKVLVIRKPDVSMLKDWTIKLVA